MSDLKVPPATAIELLTERIACIRPLFSHGSGPEYYEFVGWCSKTWAAIDTIYGSGDPRADEIRILGLPACSCNLKREAPLLLDVYESQLAAYIREIQEEMPESH